MVPALTPLTTSHSRFSFTLYLGSQLSTGRCLNNKPLNLGSEHLTGTNKRHSVKSPSSFVEVHNTCLNFVLSHSSGTVNCLIRTQRLSESLCNRFCMLTVHQDCDSVPEELLDFFSDGELSTLLVKFSVKVWEAVCRPVNHITWALWVHGYNVLEYVKNIQNALCGLSLQFKDLLHILFCVNPH